MRRWFCKLLGVVLIFNSTLPLAAQDLGFPVFESIIPVASINQPQLLQGSAYGRALLQQLEVEKQVLETENRDLLEGLEQEELNLTELRNRLPAEEFSPMALAFDSKAQRLRREQEQKSDALNQKAEELQIRFFQQAKAIILQIMQEEGILFLLDENVVLLSQGGDITATVIAKLDAAYAAGELSIE